MWRVIGVAGVSGALALFSAPTVDAAGAEKCTLIKIAEWPVRPGTGSPVVEGAINGEKVGIMLDTGARTHLLRSAAVRLGLVRHRDRTDRAIGVGGETAVEIVAVDSFAIGDTVRRNWKMTVLGEVDFGPGVAVLLGEDFLHRSEVEFDLAHNAVRLFEAKDCDRTALAYWTRDPGVVALEDYSEARPTIEMTVEVNGRPLRALLDSGAFQSVLTKAQAAALGVTPESKGVVAAGCSGGLGPKRIEMWIGPFDTFAIGNEVVRNPRLEFADVFRYSTYAWSGSRVPQTLVHPDMLLGADFLRAHRVLIAHSQRRMYFTYAGGQVFQGRHGRACDDAPRSASEAQAAGRN